MTELNNTKIKKFDSTLGNYINQELADGLDISTVVIVLDKYLLSAKDAERKALAEEKRIEQMKELEFARKKAQEEENFEAMDESNTENEQLKNLESN